MSTRLKIKVTKEILERSKDCKDDISNCAIACAVRDVLPNAAVYEDLIIPIYDLSKRFTDQHPHYSEDAVYITLPKVARDFICAFDNDNITPDERAALPELEFEIDIPDEVIEQIDIEALRPLLINHPTLELV